MRPPPYNQTLPERLQGLNDQSEVLSSNGPCRVAHRPAAAAVGRTQKNKATSGHLGMLKVRAGGLLTDSSPFCSESASTHVCGGAPPVRLSGLLLRVSVRCRQSWQSCGESCWSPPPAAGPAPARAKVPRRLAEIPLPKQRLVQEGGSG